jgi:hypothetical protein
MTKEGVGVTEGRHNGWSSEVSGDCKYVDKS